MRIIIITKYIYYKLIFIIISKFKLRIKNYKITKTLLRII